MAYMKTLFKHAYLPVSLFVSGFGRLGAGEAKVHERSA